MKELLFDISCMNMGIPPLSGPAGDVYLMIKKMPPDRRRQISRKLKKVCKRSVAKTLQGLHPDQRKIKENFLKKHLGFKTGEELFNNSKLFTIRRIVVARKFIKRSVCYN